eukprot:scaffold184_cov316-Pinguiococcus_pyrenoidosus.AAC.25
MQSSDDDRVAATATAALRCKWSFRRNFRVDEDRDLWDSAAKEFCLKSTSGTPLLRLLYYTRSTCLRRLQQSFCDQVEVQQVLMLGGGDPSVLPAVRRNLPVSEGLDPWGLALAQQGLCVTEWDLPAICEKKTALATRIMQLEQPSGSTRFGAWKCEAVDLRQAEETSAALHRLADDATTMVIAECCLSYLQQDVQDHLLRAISTRFQRVIFLRFDPCGADTAFWSKTRTEFVERGLPLFACDGVAGRRRQLFETGFVLGRTWDLSGAAKYLVALETWDEIAQREVFDEFASLVSTFACYAISAATNFEMDHVDHGLRRSIEIGNATAGDAEAIRTLVLNAFTPFMEDSSVKKYVRRNVEKDFKSSGPFFSTSSDARGPLLVARSCEGRIVGCAGLLLRGPREAELKHVAVAADYRRRGVARGLVLAILRRQVELVDRGEVAADSRVYLTTLENMSAAQALYLSLGFERVQAEQAAYPQFQLTVEAARNLMEQPTGEDDGHPAIR